MQHTHTKANFILLLTAFIWGLAFVAQRAGMEHIGPFAFNAIRFALGTLSLLPLLWLRRNKKSQAYNTQTLLRAGLLSGLLLFLGSSFQQIGMVYTTAGNGGFITSLYVILVPLLGLFWKQKVQKQIWIGAFIALVGLYFLTHHTDNTFVLGDYLILLSAFFFAGHVLVIGNYATQTNILKLSVFQFFIASFLSFLIAFVFETTTYDNIKMAAIPILYGGIMSVGVAYTLQVVGQKNTAPAIAAIILSFESLFAAIGGIIILNEPLTLRIAIGGVLMLSGVIFSQLTFKRKINNWFRKPV